MLRWMTGPAWSARRTSLTSGREAGREAGCTDGCDCAVPGSATDRATDSNSDTDTDSDRDRDRVADKVGDRRIVTRAARDESSVGIVRDERGKGRSRALYGADLPKRARRAVRGR